VNRILAWLHSLIRVVPVDPGPVALDWCNHRWITWTDGRMHTCDDFDGHGGAVHTCGCGQERLTDQAAQRLIDALSQTPEHDDCTWQGDEPCPRHDERRPWPAGRDCQGTCTNCNSDASQWHAPSCPHYDPDAIAAVDRITRRLQP
jgi:hypothetical protein